MNDADKKRNDQAVKIEKAIARKAKLVCDRRLSKTNAGKLTLAEYLSDLLRPLVEKDYAKELASMQAEIEQGKKKD